MYIRKVVCYFFKNFYVYRGPIIIFSVDIELGITLIVLLSGCTPKPITPTSRRNPFSLLF